MKLLEFVQEWQNRYSVTVNVVVPLHNLPYSRIWLLIKGWMCVCSCVSRMVSVYKPSADKNMLVEKTKEMRMAVSTRKLPQKTPATILQEKKDLSSNEVGRHRIS